jgi:cell division transport system permease protein
MKGLKLLRTFKEGAHNYRRNGWLTFATVSILTISLFVISQTALLVFSGHLAIKNLESKVSIALSFNPEVTEERILSIKSDLEKYDKEIQSVQYVSRDDALKDFLSTGDPVLSAAVKEIGSNPLLASLVIKATDPSYYELIAQKINESSFKSEISRNNYDKNRKLIDNMNRYTARVQRIGITEGSIFTLIAILITFNTIRLTIYSHRQEFEVMRLVGASDLYIKMPFFFEGIFYGLTAAIVTIIALGIDIKYMTDPLSDPSLSNFSGQSFFSLYLHSLWFILPGATLLGTGLGILSGLIAIRKYLKI